MAFQIYLNNISKWWSNNGSTPVALLVIVGGQNYLEIPEIVVLYCCQLKIIKNQMFFCWVSRNWETEQSCDCLQVLLWLSFIAVLHINSAVRIAKYCQYVCAYTRSTLPHRKYNMLSLCMKIPFRILTPKKCLCFI